MSKKATPTEVPPGVVRPPPPGYAMQVGDLTARNKIDFVMAINVMK